LKRFKIILGSVRQRGKNICTLTALGLLQEDIFQILLELTPQNYYDPSTGDNTDEADYCIWEFGVIIEQREIFPVNTLS